jgi:hypothetical protein
VSDMPVTSDGALVVAGRAIPRPADHIITYLQTFPPTVTRFDLGQPGDPDLLTAAEVTRTRVINSRISHAQVDWFVTRAAQAGTLWAAVPAAARLADANPQTKGGLYDHFVRPREPGVWVAKVSKVLHLKRPHLIPILDSRLLATYEKPARAAAERHRAARPGYKRLNWVAIRDDLIVPANVAALARLRRSLAGHPDDRVRRAAELSDVRLLDILVWQTWSNVAR